VGVGVGGVGSALPAEALPAPAAFSGAAGAAALEPEADAAEPGVTRVAPGSISQEAAARIGTQNSARSMGGGHGPGRRPMDAAPGENRDQRGAVERARPLPMIGSPRRGTSGSPARNGIASRSLWLAGARAQHAADRGAEAGHVVDQLVEV